MFSLLLLTLLLVGANQTLNKGESDMEKLVDQKIKLSLDKISNKSTPAEVMNTTQNLNKVALNAEQMVQATEAIIQALINLDNGKSTTESLKRVAEKVRDITAKTSGTTESTSSVPTKAEDASKAEESAQVNKGNMIKLLMKPVDVTDPANIKMDTSEEHSQAENVTGANIDNPNSTQTESSTYKLGDQPTPATADSPLMIHITELLKNNGTPIEDEVNISSRNKRDVLTSINTWIAENIFGLEVLKPPITQALLERLRMSQAMEYMRMRERLAGIIRFLDKRLDLSMIPLKDITPIPRINAVRIEKQPKLLLENPTSINMEEKAQPKNLSTATETVTQSENLAITKTMSELNKPSAKNTELRTNAATITSEETKITTMTSEPAEVTATTATPTTKNIEIAEKIAIPSTSDSGGIIENKITIAVSSTETASNPASTASPSAIEHIHTVNGDNVVTNTTAQSSGTIHLNAKPDTSNTINSQVGRDTTNNTINQTEDLPSNLTQHDSK